MSAPDLHVVYSDAMVGDPWRAAALGPVKALAVADALRQSPLPLVWVAPDPVSREDLYRAHDRSFVDDVVDRRRPSAFGTKSQDLARSLPFTSGGLYASTVLALAHGVSASLTSGFHHATFDRPSRSARSTVWWSRACKSNPTGRTQRWSSCT